MATQAIPGSGAGVGGRPMAGSAPVRRAAGDPGLDEREDGRRDHARRYLLQATLLTAAGVAFSGYLSGVKMMSGVCAFSEPCPMFLGRPACYTGFALFAAMFVTTLAALALRVRTRWPMAANAVVAAVGVVFAGTLTVGEVVAHAGVPVYGMGLPTCSYGALFFAAILVVSGISWRRQGGWMGVRSLRP